MLGGQKCYNVLCLWGLPGYQPIIVIFFVEKIQQFHFDHLLTWVPKSLYFIHGSESAKIFSQFVGGLAAAEWFVSKKSHKCMSLVLVRFETWTLIDQKNFVFQNFFLFFLKFDMTRWVFPCFRKPSHNSFVGKRPFYICM